MNTTLENLLATKKFQCSNHIFKFDRFLGKGGFGSCYSFKSETNDSIAVKAIVKNEIKHTSIVHEMEIHKSLNHENIVRYFSKTEDNKYYYIIMETCDKSLQHMFHMEKMLPLEKLQKYGKGILQGLAYLHNHNIVHRDIKLENILISSNDVAKIADFGLSRSLNDIKESNHLVFCGSYYYLAPEIITNFNYSTASDIWSYGVVMYRLTTRYYPFFGSKEDLFYRIKNIIYNRCGSLNMNPNGRRLIQLFCYIFRPLEKRLNARELLNRSFFKKRLIADGDIVQQTNDTDEIINSCAITKSLPENLTAILGMLFKKLNNCNTLEVDQTQDFVYIIDYLDYTSSYGLMYYLSNNICGFWNFDQSTFFRYSNKFFRYKYTNGQRYLTCNQSISSSKKVRFQTLLNELLPLGSKTQDNDDDSSTIPEPIFINYWVQTVKYFIMILSNGTINIEMYKKFRDNACDKYVINGSGRLYLKLFQNDHVFLRPFGRYEQELFFKNNPQILEILTNILSKK